MCGINGILGLASADSESIVARMNNVLAHRGPDDHGVLAEGPIALGHQRLSILDLSSAGHQPMHSADGSVSIVFNGEIYNFRELKEQLSSYPFHTSTDTEVLLAAWQAWGIDMLSRLNGMFAFAIWDRKKKELWIARDRLGIKPLYYYSDEEIFAFSSELRPLLKSKLVKAHVNHHSLIDYLRYQTVHAPHTIVEDVKMLLPGHFLRADLHGHEIKRWWDPTASRVKIPTDYESLLSKTRELFFDAVRDRLVSDVPFGAFLSGGIDSASVVAAMATVSDTSVKTFNIAFREDEFSEAVYARMVAEKFQTDHHEILLSADDFLHDLPQALAAIDHPSGDGPNTWIVSRATRKAGITMALSGLGGDELFAGYEIFRQLPRLSRYKWFLSFPPIMRKMAATLIQFRRPGVAGRKMASIIQAPYFDIKNIYPFYRQVLFDSDIRKLAKKNILPPNMVSELADSLVGYKTDGFTMPYLSKISMVEMHTYMQNVLLRDTDQMSMAHALEVRVPFLDHRLVEFVLSIEDEHKFPYTPKRLLVDAMGSLLPPEIVNRPKMGFTLPWKHWMKNELRDFCETRLVRFGERSGLKKQGVLNLWSDFLADKPSVTWSRIWPLVVLEEWMDKNNADLG